MLLMVTLTLITQSLANLLGITVNYLDNQQQLSAFEHVDVDVVKATC